MKKILLPLLSLAMAAFAADIQILDPVGAEFAPNAPQMVRSLVQASVSQSGNTPVDGAAELQLRTTLMTMGSSIVVVCDQLKNGQVIGSGKQKAASLDDLDVAIEGAANAALGVAPAAPASSGSLSSVNSAEPAPAPAAQPAPAQQTQTIVVVTEKRDEGGALYASDPNDNFARKRPTRNYKSWGVGFAMWHNWEDKEHNPEIDWDPSIVLHSAQLWELTPQVAIKLLTNQNFGVGDEFHWHWTSLVGARYFTSDGSNTVTPFLGAGFGIGFDLDGNFSGGSGCVAGGLAGGLEAGIIVARSSAAQLEVGFAWDFVFDEFDGFDQRYGAGSIYIALNR